MATGIVQPSVHPPAPPVSGESIERERIIQRQLARASLYVRLVDLAGGMAVWLISVLLLFIAAAAIDHWIGLGVAGRFVALAVLIGGSLWFLAMHVAPLVVRSINPTYAARTIEAAAPSLKNSLINFLLLRQDKAGIREIVYQAVEKQAAADITSVPVETTVDRTRLIHAGYCLCGVMAIFAAYKILSPKDPFQTVARVLAPWATIARPSRVQISEVEPGNTEVYHGQTIKIAATIRGLRTKDRVHLHYTTADGQIVDQPVEMKNTAGDRYECSLPPGESAAHALAGGLQQNTGYRLVAGDAESQVYRLTVLSSPTIIIDRVEYEFPVYTRKPPEIVRQQGDIKALEGTKVTLHAVANQPIRTAWLELDPTTSAGAAELANMTADGDRARGQLTLLVRPDRQTPWHASYQVRFHNQRSEKSEQPILHRIDVIRDLAPEVQIVQPERLRVEVPENGELTIAVRGVDPDFGLSSLRLEGEAAGKQPIAVELLPDPASHPPQATAQYVFRPREHKLSAGDELSYAAVAQDNRTSPRTGQPEANVTRTKDYKLVVTAARSDGQKTGKSSTGEPQPKPQQDQKAKAGEQQRNGKSGDRPSDQPQQPMNPGDSQKENNQKQSDQKQKSDTGDNPQQDGQRQQNETNQQEGQQQPGQAQGDKQKSGEQQSGQQQNGQQQNGQQQSGEQQSGQQQSGQQQGGQQQSGEGTSGNSGAAQNGQQSGNQQSGSGGTSTSAGGQQGGQQQQSPGSKDGQGKAEHDGQAIERIFKEIQQRQQESGEQSENQSGQNRPASDGQQRDGQQRDGQQQPQGDSETNPAAGGNSKPGNSSKSSDISKSSDPNSAEPGGQPQASGQSGQQNAGTQSAGRPEANDQGQKAGSVKQPSDQQGKKSENAGDRVPDDKQGQSPAEQPSGGSKGGAPQGHSKTDKGEKSKAGQGEKRDAGAGDNGDEGAGQASDDKSASGPGARKNADRNKESKPDTNKPESSEASNQSDSKRQSDSKGGESGPQSGGGAKGGGQSAGHEGNDSAGSKSAADQGAGKANETGGGETGTKAGDQQQAGGQTGKSGEQKGAGSKSQPGGENAGNGQSSPSGAPDGDQGSKSAKGQPKSGGQTGDAPVGGTDDGRERRPPPDRQHEDIPADEANLEYARKATEMVLRRLKEEEHNPDPDLLDKLGWTREDLAEFLRRWDTLEKTAAQSPAGKRELDEALRSLGLRDPAAHRRVGGAVADKQRDLRDAGNRSTAPPRYRDLFDAFRKGAARSQ